MFCTFGRCGCAGKYQWQTHTARLHCISLLSSQWPEGLCYDLGRGARRNPKAVSFCLFSQDIPALDPCSASQNRPKGSNLHQQTPTWSCGCHHPPWQDTGQIGLETSPAGTSETRKPEKISNTRFTYKFLNNLQFSLIQLPTLHIFGAWNSILYSVTQV